MVVANHATLSSTFTILSPVGLFCVMINLILINNFIISTANIHFFLIYANLRTFYGLFTDFLRSYFIYKTISSGRVVRGGVAQPLAAVSRRLGQVSGWAERVVGWLEFLGLARCVGLRVGSGQAQKPSHCGLGCGGVRLDWLEFLALARCVGLRVGRGQRQKPSHSGTACN